MQNNSRWLLRIAACGLRLLDWVLGLIFHLNHGTMNKCLDFFYCVISEPMKVAFISLAICFVAFGCARHEEDEQQIMFAAKAYYESADTTGEGYVYVAGTLTGDGVAYKNNSVVVACYKDRMECLTYVVDQIGPNHVGRLDAPTSYPVVKWDNYVIVATGGGEVNCRKDTISIARKAQTVVWVQERIDQSRAACKDADTRVLKWTIEDSPGWKALQLRK